MFNYINNLLKKFKTSEKGQAFIEYFLIVAIVAGIAMFTFNNGLRDVLVNAFKNSEELVSEAAETIATTANTETTETTDEAIE